MALPCFRLLLIRTKDHIYKTMVNVLEITRFMTDLGSKENKLCFVQFYVGFWVSSYIKSGVWWLLIGLSDFRAHWRLAVSCPIYSLQQFRFLLETKSTNMRRCLGLSLGFFSQFIPASESDLSRSHTPSVRNSSCVGKNGFYADTARICTVYYLCSPDGSRVEFECPPGQRFDITDQACLNASQVLCIEDVSFELSDM